MYLDRKIFTRTPKNHNHKKKVKMQQKLGEEYEQEIHKGENSSSQLEKLFNHLID